MTPMDVLLEAVTVVRSAFLRVQAIEMHSLMFTLGFIWTFSKLDDISLLVSGTRGMRSLTIKFREPLFAI